MKKYFYLLMTAMMVTSCYNKIECPMPETPSTDEVVKEVIMSRRSIRQYQEATIGRDTLDAIMQMGINAPNGMNRQAYEVRVIDNPALIDEMTAAVVKDNPKVAERPGFKNIFVNAPCVVFIATDPSYDMAKIDCGLMGENIILSAWSMGIGSCCLGGPVRMLKDSPSALPYLERLGFSEGYDLTLCIALGYPAETPDAKPRDGEKVRYIE